MNSLLSSLTATLHSLFSIGKFPIAIQVSIGASLYPEHNYEPEVLTLYTDLGHISPDEFVPLAERSGLINELTYWAINESLPQCARWRDEHGQFYQTGGQSVCSNPDRP